VIIKIYFDHIVFPTIYSDIYINIDCTILFIDRKILISVASNAKIVEVSVIQIREIEINLYQYSEYGFLNLYLPDNTATAIIQCDAKIVDNLKTNILIGIDIIGSENINVFTSINRIIIDSCQNLQKPV
jgi:hypothetical protein